MNQATKPKLISQPNRWVEWRDADGDLQMVREAREGIVSVSGRMSLANLKRALELLEKGE